MIIKNSSAKTTTWGKLRIRKGKKVMGLEDLKKRKTYEYLVIPIRRCSEAN